MSLEIIYLGTPYTHESPDVRQARFDVVTCYAATLWASGRGVYSPITQTHEAAKRATLPHEWAFWESQCRAFLSLCTEMMFLALPGWRQSVGLQAEMKIARAMGIPVRQVTPSGILLCKTCPEMILSPERCRQLCPESCLYGELGVMQ